MLYAALGSFFRVELVQQPFFTLVIGHSL